jgi:hypothetical protein
MDDLAMAAQDTLSNPQNALDCMSGEETGGSAAGRTDLSDTDREVRSEPNLARPRGAHMPTAHLAHAHLVAVPPDPLALGTGSATRAETIATSRDRPSCALTRLAAHLTVHLTGHFGPHAGHTSHTCSGSANDNEGARRAGGRRADGARGMADPEKSLAQRGQAEGLRREAATAASRGSSKIESSSRAGREIGGDGDRIHAQANNGARVHRARGAASGTPAQARTPRASAATREPTQKHTPRDPLSRQNTSMLFLCSLFLSSFTGTLVAELYVHGAEQKRE